MTPAPINPHIFRAYDIRGVAGDDFSPAVMERIARAHGTLLRRRFAARSLVIGRDNRPSSEALYDAAIRGLRASGLDVIGIGLAPSPLMYFAAHIWGTGGGISITASHNPVQFNGAKLLREQAMPLLPEEIEAVRDLAAAADFETGAGSFEARDPAPAYLAMLAQRFPLARPLHLVADPGNGVATLTGPAALAAIGAKVTGLYTELLPGFPNHVANPQDAETMRDLAAEVRARGADLGVAWDGDGDRVGVVDERGVRYEADWLVALIARELLARHPGARIMLDLKTSLAVVEDIREHGGEPVLTRTGYSLIKRAMRDQRILFGGEASGHIMFGEDYPYLDDGVFAACAIAAIVAASDRPLSAHFAGMRQLITSPELGLPCDDASKFAVAEAIAARFRSEYEVLEIDGARITFPDRGHGGGWALVRASNTTPVLSVRIEAETRVRFEEIREVLWAALGEHPQVTIPAGAGDPAPAS